MNQESGFDVYAAPPVNKAQIFSASGAVAATPRPALLAAIGRLQEQLASLSSVVDGLIGAIDPVMVPAAPEAESSRTNGPAPVCSRLTNEIDTLSDAVAGIRRRVEMAMGRVNL